MRRAVAAPVLGTAVGVHAGFAVSLLAGDSLRLGAVAGGLLLGVAYGLAQMLAPALGRWTARAAVGAAFSLLAAAASAAFLREQNPLLDAQTGMRLWILLFGFVLSVELVARLTWRMVSALTLLVARVTGLTGARRTHRADAA